MTTGRDNPDPPELAVDAAVDEPRTDPQPDGAAATAGASQPHDEAATRAWEGLPPDTMILASALALFATASEATLMCVLPRDWSKPGARVCSGLRRSALDGSQRQPVVWPPPARVLFMQVRGIPMIPGGKPPDPVVVGLAGQGIVVRRIEPVCTRSSDVARTAP